VLGPLITNGNVAVRTSGATQQTGEPKPPGINIGTAGTVWYRYEPRGEGGGNITLDFQAGYDSVIAVYRGSSLTSLIPIASNNNPAGNNSKVTFAARNDRNYYIQATGYNGAAGTGMIYLSRQPFSADTTAPWRTWRAPVEDQTGVSRNVIPASRWSEDVGHAGRNYVYLWRWNGSSWVQLSTSKRYTDYGNKLELIPSIRPLNANTWYSVRFSVYDAHGNYTSRAWKFKTGA
jgi:hypothetical protein